MNAIKHHKNFEHTFAIVQITRLGDLLQALQAASAFKYQHPNVKLILIARKQFAEGLNFLLKQVFDEIYSFNLKDFYGEDGSQDLNTIVNNLDIFIKNINKEKIDVLINLSFSKSSSYLTGLIEARHKMGLERDQRGELIISDKWSQFVYSNVMNGANNPFSLVDIFRKMMGTKQIPLVFGSANTKKTNSKKIIIHPFASSKKKRWGITKWGEVIYQLLKTIPEAQIHIMGGPGDMNEANSLGETPTLQAFKKRIHFKVGKYSLEETFGNFQDADLFLGHDSMGGHMAALQAVTSITLSLGTVRPHETTPYGHNNYNMAPRIKCFPCFPDDKCDLLPCHANISHQSVVALSQAILSGETINHKVLAQKISAFHMDSIHIYQTEINASHGLTIQDLAQNPETISSIFKNFYQVMWTFMFEEVEIRLPLPSLNRELLSNLSHYQSGLQQLFELNNFGVKFSQYIIDETKLDSPRIDHIRDYSSKLSEIDGLTKVLKTHYPLLSPVIDFYFVAKANLSGNNVIELAESSYVTFFEFNNAVQILNELVGACLNTSQAKLMRTNKEVVKEIDN
ncbi:MAG: glycosyltransferase family 9 protein [Bacteriovoracaceae bacterium]